MKELSEDEMTNVMQWLDQFGLVKSQKLMHREFSDGVLAASLLKQLYPKMVESHNYPNRNSYHLKMDNWNTLNRKVMRKLGLTQSTGMLENLCNAVAGAGELLCYEIMTKYLSDQKNKADKLYDDDNISENTDVMCVNVEKKNANGEVKHVVQRVVAYSLYEKAQIELNEQQQAIAILTQKIEHLDNLLKLKCQRIEDLLTQLARRTNRVKTESDLHLMAEPNLLSPSSA